MMFSAASISQRLARTAVPHRLNASRVARGGILAQLRGVCSVRTSAPQAPDTSGPAPRHTHRKPTAGSKYRIQSKLPGEDGAPAEVDVAVVGCGSAGLLAAATLANQGLSVHCFDAHYVAGGCATQFGRTVRKGPHAGLYR